MPLDATGQLAQDLLDLTARLGARAEDPFGNPVLLVALAISRRMDALALAEADVAALIRLCATPPSPTARTACRLCRRRRHATEHRSPGRTGAAPVAAGPKRQPVRWVEYRALVERTRFAAVFTAHPTFAMPVPAGHALAETASGRPTAPALPSHRPPPISLADEFAQAVAAIANGRDAIDRFNTALLSVARSAWPDRWTELAPRPVILSSWVGYDTDGRTDIGWWDTLRLRLEMKRLQLARLHGQVAVLPATEALAARSPRAGHGRRTARPLSRSAGPSARRGVRAGLVRRREAYTMFNGSTENYDGFGRNASGNNTVFLYAWMAF